MSDRSSSTPLQRARLELERQLGQEVHLSDWIEISQARIDEFAAVTGDRQWIHTDPERAARESPWRSTVAHGYLTLALYPVLRGIGDGSVAHVTGVRTIVNTGINRLRFVNPVRAGARIRGRSRLIAVEKLLGCLQVTEEFTVEIEGERKPACIAEVLARLFF